jgi:hypothetical protein
LEMGVRSFEHVENVRVKRWHGASVALTLR